MTHACDQSALHQQLECYLAQHALPQLVLSTLRQHWSGDLTSTYALLTSICLDNLQDGRGLPLDPVYHRKLLTAVFKTAEAAGAVVDARTSDWFAALLAAPPAAEEEGLVHRGYFCTGPAAAAGDTRAPPPPPRTFLRLRVSCSITRGNTGCALWAAALYLAEYVLSNPQLFRGAGAAVELGCGTGLVGLALQCVGARSATLTDSSAEALANTRHNIAWNQPAVGTWPQSSPQVPELLERQWGSAGAWDSVHADIVVGSDIVYDPECLPDLCATLGRLLRRPEGEGTSTSQAEPRAAYIASTLRNAETLEAFLGRLSVEGLCAREVKRELFQDRSQSIQFQHVLGLDDSLLVLHRITA